MDKGGAIFYSSMMKIGGEMGYIVKDATEQFYARRG
jgi:hypothetical protein